MLSIFKQHNKTFKKRYGWILIKLKWRPVAVLSPALYSTVSLESNIDIPFWFTCFRKKKKRKHIVSHGIDIQCFLTYIFN